MPSEANITDVPVLRRLAFAPGLAPHRAVPAPWRLPPLVAPACLLVADLASWAMAASARSAHPGGATTLFLAVSLWLLARADGYRAGRPLPPGSHIASAGPALGRALAACLVADLLLCGPDLLADSARTLVACALAMLAGRILAGIALRHALAGKLAPRAVLVGDAAAAPALATWRGDCMTPRLLGWIDTGDGAASPAGIPALGDLARLEHLARAGAVDQVILALPVAAPATAQVIRRCAALPVEIRLALPSLPGRRSHLGPVTLAHLLDPPVTGWAGLAKRGEDLLLGAVLLIACAGPMTLLALAIRLDSAGPVLFRQRRVGFQGRGFEMLKFRTMRHEPAPAPGCVQAVRDDPRVTRLGAFLRRTSLDELPQLFNVMRGEMSLVGPRPHAPGTSADGRVFEEVVPFYAGRHRVKPGITGLAQVRGLRGETRTHADVLARVEADYEYIQRWSLGLDLAILLRTALAVLSMRNAY